VKYVVYDEYVKMTNMTKKARGFEKNSSPGCAPTLVTLRWTQRYIILVLRVVVPCGGGSGGRECRGWSGGGWSGGSAAPAATAAAPRKAALDAQPQMLASSSIWLRRKS
jgi:hypothetical protein